MALMFNRNTKTIKDIFDNFCEKKLIIDPSYQRRKVWMQQDKVRLIETILLELIIPEVFFWPASIEADTGRMVTHIVDGQQRITSIVEFISGEFSLTEKYLLNDSIKTRCGNKTFNDLSQIDKSTLWKYPVSVVDIDSTFNKQDITQMFYRLNLTNYNLNMQEKRNSKESCFGDVATALSELDFWKFCRVFSSADAKRMKDVEYCCSIYILAIEGIIDQTNDKKINDYYDDYADSFDEVREFTNKIVSAMDIIQSLCDKTTISFVSKKAQMYTLFSFIFKLIDDKIEFTEEISNRFKFFVATYNAFRNEYDINFEDSKSQELRELNESIKKYKLASSEGINKIRNRVIRLESLFDICVKKPNNVKNQLSTLAKLYEKEKQKNISYDKFDSEDIIDRDDV